MRKFIQMVLVLSAISFLAGLALGSLNSATKEPIRNNTLRFKKLPAVIDIAKTYMGEISAEETKALEDLLLIDRREIAVEDTTHLVFMIRRDGEPHGFVIESSGSGYGGAVTAMVGIDIAGSKLIGVAVAGHSETPGVGSRVTETAFTGQFPWMDTTANFKLKKNGGEVDGISGATYSSAAVCTAVTQATSFYKAHGEEVRKAFEL